MIAIVISACLVGNPDVCKDYRIPLAREVGPNQCVADAPPYFANWAARYPDWRIVRWRCTTSEVQDL